MIVIVDYRAGNLTSVKKALDRVGAASVVSDDPAVVVRADKIVLPGVGHFAATATLARTGLRQSIQSAIERGAPFLGICVGMQWMFAASEEAPRVPGLELFPGECRKFPKEYKSPHVGWNALQCDSESRLLCGVGSGSFVYFTHSYRAPIVEGTVARCDYGGEFSAAVEKDHLFGVQFHPEKSGAVGLALLETFCRL